MPWYVRATRFFLSSEGECSLTNVSICCDRIQEFSDKRGLDYEGMYGYPIKTGVILIQEDGEPWSDVVHNFLCLETEEVIKASRFWKDGD